MAVIKPALGTQAGPLLALVAILALSGGDGRAADDRAEKASPPAANAEGEAKEALPEKIAGPQDLLKYYGIDQSHFDRLADGSPWQEGENELLLRLLYRLRDFRLREIETWAKPLTRASELADEPATRRGEFYRLQGRVKQVELCQPLAEVVERFELTRYYRIDFLMGDDQQPAVIFTETIPQAWKPGQVLNERAGALGMFLKLSAADAKRPAPVFVARRVAWYPPTELGDLGMDYGLFDDLTSQESTTEQDAQTKAKPSRDLGALRLGSRTSECFYQMLAAAGRAKPGELQQKASRALQKSGKKNDSVVSLFNQPQNQYGRLVVLTGNVRQVIPVRIGKEEEDIQTRFGIAQYYQMFLFTDDSQGNPLVFCVRKLPKGMPTGEDPHYAEQVTVAGFFFNTWAYRNRDSSGPLGQARWQLAPLLIGHELTWHPRPTKPSNAGAGAVFAGLFVVVVVGVGVAMWRSRRADQRFRETVFQKRLTPQAGLSLDELGQNRGSADDGPSDRGDTPTDDRG
jgi:hypothetical protein